MIRGAIEVASDNLVSGWIHDDADKLRGKLLLAFSGKRCVGSGLIEIFRQDLLDAKLGDGYGGFHFPLVLEKGEHPASVVVRLADSDAALIQPNSVVGPAALSATVAAEPKPKAPEVAPVAPVAPVVTSKTRVRSA